MNKIEIIPSVGDVPRVAELCKSLGIKKHHPIPLFKILFTFHRKGFTGTIVREYGPASKQYEEECSLNNNDKNSLVRLHFFSNELTDLTYEVLQEAVYGGYCDVRPDGDGTLVEAFVTWETVIREKSDGYVFLPCRMEKRVEIPCSDGGILPFVLYGFPYAEKNMRETMCAQVALLGMFDYWTAHGLKGLPQTTIQINKGAGLSQQDQNAVTRRGLSPDEIANLLEDLDVNYVIQSYGHLTREGIAQRAVAEDIYGYIESGFPVVAAVKTVRSMHAITFIGHTFDRNSWQAMAEIGYFGRAQGEFFHPNVTWIENLIIQDDNFGPYYFFPTATLNDIIYAIIVVFPSKDIDKSLTPRLVSRNVVKQTMASKPFLQFLQKLTPRGEMKPNRSWLIEFLNHLKVTCGDGLILRPMIRQTHQIVEYYRDHEFAPHVSLTMRGYPRNKHFWVVELSWPDIYCFRQCLCGLVVVDAYSGKIKAIHVPGAWITFRKDGTFLTVAQKEDPPRAHLTPGMLP